ncbi:MAG: cytochrome ubiquinol oxidase subunit I [Deltaproteobacteria bacterium]|nr:cytochrome ubiquinol oxidase subunit I [Deltaproteobacteria bacterium]
MMDVLTLSRWQFAVTGMFHFIFVPLTLGLSILIAYFETRYVMTNDETWLKMAKFWGKLFLINFILGIVTGITMEFQLGMNWAEYSKYVGDIFGAPLAIEAMVAFFLESVFIGVWVFGWNKISKKMHAISIWIVAVATNLSALWILLANGWMQHPVGYHLVTNTAGQVRAEMIDFVAMLVNPYGLIKFAHTVTSGYVVAAFFVMGISAWHLVRRNEMTFFKRSFRAASIFGLVACILVAVTGEFHGVEIAKTQPTKLAAMEAVWETQRGVPLSLIQFPDVDNERNSIAWLNIPNLVSFLAVHDANGEVKGLKDFPKELRPPVLPTFWSFRIMVALGMFMTFISMLGVYLSGKKDFEKYKLFLSVVLFSLPLPYIAGQLGWIVAEVGRQPWIVYGVLKTSDAVSKSISTVQVVGSLLGFTLLYGGLAVIDIYLLAKYSRKGPDGILTSISYATERRN